MAILLFILVSVNEFLNTFSENYAKPKNLMHAFVDDMCTTETVPYNESPEINANINDINICMLKTKCA